MDGVFTAVISLFFFTLTKLDHPLLIICNEDLSFIY